MSAWHGTVLSYCLDSNVDGREEVTLPILSQAEMQRFVKLSIQHIPGAHKTFNDVFGGKKSASDYPPGRLIDNGVPTFLWVGR